MAADSTKSALLQRIAAADAKGLASPEEWKALGGEAYKLQAWSEALRCYTSALRWCQKGSDLEVTCLNNRAACHGQLKAHAAVVEDTTRVLERQPANVKALMRRMVALEALGQIDKALQDAGSVLTMEPKNPQALEVVNRKKKSLAKKTASEVPRGQQSVPRQTLAVCLFTQDRPLHCYACLRSLRKHMRQVTVDVHVFWQADSPACAQSYRLLRSLPEVSTMLSGDQDDGDVSWIDCSQGQLFPAFTRAVNTMSTRGQPALLLLSDTVVFHTDVDGRAVLDVLEERSQAVTGVFSCRLDIHPRVHFFPEADILRSAPALKAYDRDPQILLWTRWYDKSQQAYQAVLREVGWDAILDWTATVVRTHEIQHFFSALSPPPTDAKDLDEKAADWLSRRQRMAKSEVAHRSACLREPVLVRLDPAEFGPAEESDRLLRTHLLRSSGGLGKIESLARQLGWKAQQLEDYFCGIEFANSTRAEEAVRGLLLPALYRPHYFDSVWVPAVPPACGLPQVLKLPGPLVSWLIPARSVEGFLMDCLCSIEKQERMGPGSYEVIIVEDASEDGTLALARKFAAGRPYVKVIDNPVQMGTSDALREGWPHCQGDFVARLDADDEAMPDRLQKQLRYMEQHKTISVLGGRVLPFWTETRKCTVERCGEKQGGRMAVIAWREFHGNQTSRQRETFTLNRAGDRLVLEDASTEYHGCRVVSIGDNPVALDPDSWRKALRDAQGHLAELTLQRRDPAEQEKGSRYLHPALIRAMGIFEECLSGTTAMFRREHFPKDDGPFQTAESDEWCWLSLESHQPAANLADALVHQRRHIASREHMQAGALASSALEAVRWHLSTAYGLQVDLEDAAALRHFRGPRSPEQGERLVELLKQVERAILEELVRPTAEENRGEFWTDFIQGRESALERAISAARSQFQEIADERAKAITKVEDRSPREKRSRTPPR